MLVVLLILNNILLTVPLFPLIIILLTTGCVLCAAVRDQSRIPNTAHSLSQTDTKETNFKKMQIRKQFWKSRDGNHPLTSQRLSLIQLVFFSFLPVRMSPIYPPKNRKGHGEGELEVSACPSSK